MDINKLKQQYNELSAEAISDRIKLRAKESLLKTLKDIIYNDKQRKSA